MESVGVFPESYGYVICVALLAFLLNFYYIFNVVKARKIYKVQLPDLYSKDSKIFNCIQRVHQNYFETITFFYLLLFLGGFQCPKLSAFFGIVFIVSRIVYSIGYSTGIVNNRLYGVAGTYVSILGLLIQSMIVAYRLC